MPYEAPIADLQSPTEKFAARLKDPSQWKIVANVPVFDEHEEQSVGQDGQPRLERFGLTELQQHADNCNRMVASGNPPGITLGHTRDDGPESAQPETVGFGTNYRVRYDANLGRHVIAHDELYFPEKYETVKSYPYRSVERWRSGQYFKPVALLRREPRRNLGVVMAYQAQVAGELDRFDVQTYQAEGDTVIRYSMEYAMPHMPPGKPEASPDASPGKPPAPPPSAGAPPGAATPPGQPGQPVTASPSQPMEPSEEDKQLFAAMCYAHPALGAMIKKYEAEQAAQPPGVPGQPPMPPVPPGQPVQNAAGGMGIGMPSATNTTLPALNRDKGPDQMSANTADVERYQRRIDELESRDRDRDARLAELEKNERVARYGYKLRHMEEVEGYPINYVDETMRCQDYSQEQFDQHIADIVQYGASARKPLGGPVRIWDMPAPESTGAEQKPMTREQYDSALRYQAENPGKSMDECIRYAKSGQNGQPVRG